MIDLLCVFPIPRL